MKYYFKSFIFMLAIIFGAGLAAYGFYIGDTDPSSKGGFAFGGAFVFVLTVAAFLIDVVINEKIE